MATPLRITSKACFTTYLSGIWQQLPTELVKCYQLIQKEADKGKLVCANEQYYLLRDGLPTSWSPANCEAFLKATIGLWNR